MMAGTTLTREIRGVQASPHPGSLPKGEGDIETSSHRAPTGGWAKLIRDLSLVGGTTVVCQVLGVATSLLLRTLLDPAQIGLWQGLRMWLGLANYANLGASKAAARDLSVAIGKNDLAAAQRGLALANAVNWLGSLVFAIGLLSAAVWQATSSAAGWRNGWAWGLAFVAGWALLQRQYAFRVTLLRSQQNFRLASRLSLLEAALSLCLSAAAAWAWGVPGLCLAALVVLSASWLVLQRCDSIRLQWAWNRGEIARLMAAGGPLMLAGLAATLFASLDKWLILALLPDGAYQLGCYSLALLVTTQILGAGNFISIVTGPRYARLFGQTGGRGEVARLAAQVGQWQAALLGGLCGLAVIAGGPLLAWLLPKYESGLVSLLWLMPGTLAASLAAPLGQYLAAVEGGRRTLAALIVGIAVAATGVCAALKLQLGLPGVAAAMSLAQLVCLAVLLRLSIWPELEAGERRRYLAGLAWGFVPTLIPAAVPSWNAAGASCWMLIGQGLALWLVWCLLTAKQVKQMLREQIWPV
ncbi:MAG: lipopolysaccharide biosynthesis protein [Pirellulales bacterium]